ncbi:hypothetical protein D884_03182 [Pseudomonas sp. URMO17WK12:I10]|uniref:hypothetical protein n=1 Tax=unclassified Pseudomonas TaxID=196821 RepID=UPI0004B77E58|nr:MULTISPECIES: hypothetical protein [unclassified Pseudomonas]RDL17067.1 hypothetical protein F633_03480 [Pseudomonas sp. LAMO17WK12:I3]RED05071.1 hypothetical protein D884_03182 [Pseudomonas sp. URMO17WK12:I10]SOD08447.1 hypothetical protein SAMN05660967_01666 [Pseudomonas sp. URMO17WK12:I9]
MKRVWTVIVGPKAFQMVLMEQSLDRAGALREAQLIWPECEVVGMTDVMGIAFIVLCLLLMFQGGQP